MNIAARGAAALSVCALALLAGCADPPSACVPSVDLCNGKDDDCDGVADEGFGVGSPCTVGLGACRRTGVLRCAEDGLSAVCDAVPGTPSPETCNGIDDDCDGSVDENLPGCCIPGASRPCGAAADVGICRAGAETCGDDRAWPGTCLDADGVPVIFPGARPERCNGVDDDCDGNVDEGFNVGTACTAGTGACFARGHMVCLADGSGTVCDAVPAAPAPEVCNGIDDDCDGLVDEEGAIGCTNLWRDADGDGYGGGSPRCLCAPSGGYVATQGGDCDDANAAVHPGAVERCNGVDDDCNGVVDDGYDVGAACSAGVGACLSTAARACTLDGTGTYCPAVAGAPSVETCNGIDDDCDGVVDDGTDAELCGSTAHAAASCVAGACRLSCDAGWYDVDATAANGCECQPDALDQAGLANDCNNPYELGTLKPGQEKVVTGNIVPLDDVDWFHFSADPAAAGTGGWWWICYRLDPAYKSYVGLVTRQIKCDTARGDTGGGFSCNNNPDGQVRDYYLKVDRPWSAPLACTPDGTHWSAAYRLQVKGYTSMPSTW